MDGDQLVSEENVTFKHTCERPDTALVWRGAQAKWEGSHREISGTALWPRPEKEGVLT